MVTPAAAQLNQPAFGWCRQSDGSIARTLIQQPGAWLAWEAAMRFGAVFLYIVSSSSAALAADVEKPALLDAKPSPPSRPSGNPVAIMSAGAIMVPVALASLGTAAYFLTRNMFACGLYNDACTPAQWAAIDRDLDVGAVTAVLGVATLGVGIPLLIIGADRTIAARKKPPVIPYVAPTASGGTAGFSMRF